LEVNEAIIEVIALTRGEVTKNDVSVQTQLAEGLPLIQGDRVQLQQVILNLIITAVQAMSGAREGSRGLLIGTGKDASGGVLVAVQDSGPGLNPESFECLFDSFYTRKPGGVGMGLSICRLSKLTRDAYGSPRTPSQASPCNSLCRSTINPRHPRVRRRDLHYCSEILRRRGESGILADDEVRWAHITTTAAMR